ELPYSNGLGGFTVNRREYAIYLGPGEFTPLPWINVMANRVFGALVSESGSGCCWYGNSHSNRLTPWNNDPISDAPSEAIYIRDEDSGIFWTPTPMPVRELDAYRARHGQGYTEFEHNSHALEQTVLTFVPLQAGDSDPLRIQRLRIKNTSSRRRRLSFTSYSELILGTDREATQMHVRCNWDQNAKALFAHNAYHPDYGSRVAFAAMSPEAISYTSDRTEFLGRNGSAVSPAALRRASLSNRSGAGLDPCGALQTKFELRPGEEKTLIFMLGQTKNVAQARELIARYSDPANVELALAETQQWWDDLLKTIQVETPILSVDLLMNRWLLYQTLSCRIWGRTALYQSSGAYGFRDQLQDVMALVHASPHLARDHILRAAARQFVEGDVQHWWHPESGVGVRTRISDDLLWLPFVTAHYVRTTGDAAILDQMVPFLDGKPLEEQQTESLSIPVASATEGSLLEHCRRAVARSATAGPRGLPLIGAGDWNDGLNRVGLGGKGESVWLAWFEICVLRDFAELLGLRELHEEAQAYRTRAIQLAQTIDAQAWDGAWYRRG